MLGGLNADVAAQGFRSLQEFVTVLHVAENLEIPFVTLKKRVVTDRVALPQAVRAMRPGVDVKLELGKADKQARTTLATR